MSSFAKQLDSRLAAVLKSNEVNVLSLVSNTYSATNRGMIGNVKTFDGTSFLNVVLKSTSEVKQIEYLDLEVSCKYLLIDGEIGKGLRNSLYDALKHRFPSAIPFHSTSITLNAFEILFSSLLLGNQISKIAVFGGGRIGRSIAQFFLELGLEVILISRQSTEELKATVLGSCRQASYSNLLVVSSHRQAIGYGSHLVVGCTSGYPVIEESFVKKCGLQTIYVDVGVGTIAKGALDHLISEGNFPYMINFEIALMSWIKSFEIVRANTLRKSMGVWACGHRFIQLGIKGLVGDIVVDDVDVPTVIYGQVAIEGGLEVCSHTLNRYSENCRVV